MTFNRTVLAGLVVGLFFLGASSGASAQQPAGLPGQPLTSTGWSFNVAPYLWMPSINADLNYNLPPALGGRLPTEMSAGPGDYLPHLNFAGMFAADAQYRRFSLLTDFIYMNLSVAESHVKSLDFFGLPSEPIARSLESSTSSRLKTTIWTLAGGYTVLKGNWGNLDVLAGFRYLGAHASTDYSLALTAAGPSGAGATFGGIGNVSGSTDIWNGIVGLRGSVRLPVEGLFIPYYFDIGAGGSNLTWQVATGLGYQTGWAGVSLLYRYLSFEQGSSRLVQHLSMGGPMLMVNFSF